MSTETENQLTSGAIVPALLKFTVPFFVASLLQALYGAVDLYVVGHFDTTASISAVSIGSQVVQTLTYFITGLSMGGTVVLGRHIGANNKVGAAQAVGTQAVLFALLAVLLTATLFFGANGFISILNTPTEAVSATWTYLRISTFGIPFVVGYNAVSGIFRGLGDSTRPTVFIAIACVINVVLDFAFVGGLGMGAGGAALATALAQGCSFLIALLYMRRRGLGFSLQRQHFTLHKRTARDILIVGMPIAVQDTLCSISFMAITAIFNAMGLIVSSAVGVVEKYISLTMRPAMAFGAATAAMSAQNLGARRPDRSKQVLWYSVGLSFALGLVLFILAQICPQRLVGIFSTDQDVIATGANYLRAYAFDYLMVAFAFNYTGFFSSCGKAILPFIQSIAVTFLVRVPLTWVLSQHATQSLYIAGLAIPTASFVTVVICSCYYIFLSKRCDILQPAKEGA